ncbi:MAG: ROK family protein [Candidatus Veblenbacteria bacterium]|nr:ROK family protein [Candidatus Veblenbacteria bacterium]
MRSIKNSLGIDIGGTSIKVGYVPGPGGHCLGFANYPTPQTQAGLKALLTTIIGEYRRRYPVRRIGIGCPGPLDVKRGLVLVTPHLPWRNFAIRKFLERISRLSVALDNDANAFTLAEATWGAGRGYGNVIGLTLGTGVGGGIVINGKLYHGRGNAGELGYLLQNIKGPRGPLGERGSVQEYARLGSLLRSTLGRGRALIDVKTLAQDKSRAAESTWQKFGQVLGYAIASLTHVLDPDIVILGGQIAKAWPRFYPTLKQTLKQACIFPQPPLVSRARLGDQAGVIGAALLTD